MYNYSLQNERTTYTHNIEHSYTAFSLIKTIYNGPQPAQLQGTQKLLLVRYRYTGPVVSSPMVCQPLSNVCSTCKTYSVAFKKKRMYRHYPHQPRRVVQKCEKSTYNAYKTTTYRLESSVGQIDAAQGDEDGQEVRKHAQRHLVHLENREK